MKGDGMTRRLVTLAIVMTFVLTAGVALSQDKKPDATVRLHQGSVAVGIGYSWGGGTLSYKGKTYKVKIKGLSIGEAGIKKAEATGKVYNLPKIEDFNGNYTAAGAEATIAGGGGGTALRNQNGVVIYLASTTRGLNFKLAAEGVEMTATP